MMLRTLELRPLCHLCQDDVVSTDSAELWAQPVKYGFPLFKTGIDIPLASHLVRALCVQKLEQLRESALTAERALLYTMGFNFAILHPQVLTSILEIIFLNHICRTTSHRQMECRPIACLLIPLSNMCLCKAGCSA